MSETLQNLLAYYLWTVSPLAASLNNSEYSYDLVTRECIIIPGNVEHMDFWKSATWISCSSTHQLHPRTFNTKIVAHHLFQKYVGSQFTVPPEVLRSQPNCRYRTKNMVKAAKAPCFQISFCDSSYCADSIRQTNCLFVQDATVSKVLFQNLKPMSQVR